MHPRINAPGSVEEWFGATDRLISYLTAGVLPQFQFRQSDAKDVQTTFIAGALGRISYDPLLIHLNTAFFRGRLVALLKKAYRSI